MPFLDLTPETVSGARRSRLTLATIEAVMLWPDDEEHRKEYLAAAVAEHALAQVPSVVASDPVGAVESFSEMIAWAHSAPRISDFKKEISQRIRIRRHLRHLGNKIAIVAALPRVDRDGENLGDEAIRPHG